MAEPVDRRTVSVRVDREFLVSRLEEQLLAKVFDILIPAAHLSCAPAPRPAERTRSRHTSGRTSPTKGV
jgi:hypothetical protein